MYELRFSRVALVTTDLSEEGIVSIIRAEESAT
jgi:hypothetical protein